jgi:hypothetical protein
MMFEGALNSYVAVVAEVGSRCAALARPSHLVTGGETGQELFTQRHGSSRVAL